MQVLIVEDNALVAGALVRLLGARFHTRVVDDGEAAREILEHTRDAPFGVVLCDVAMPRLDGLTLLRWIRAERPELVRRFVFMTAEPRTPSAVEIAATHVHPILTKPFDRATLIAAIGVAGRPA